MKYPTFLTLLCASLIACASAKPTHDPYAQKLLWLDAADPQADAARAIVEGDLRLLGLAMRSISLPGIDPDDYYRYEQACGYRLIEGVSDVVRSDEHLRLIQKARGYALRYNAIIKTRCVP